jgi:hypothetical protein
MSNKINKINNLLNKSSGYGNVSNDRNTSASDKSMFSNIYFLMIIAVSSLFFIGYSIYYYLTQSNILNIIANSSYYGKDITLYEALFQESATEMTDCINLCEKNILCDGVTYNNDTQVCSGTKNGQIRNESDSFSAWVKPPDSKINNKNTKLDFTKAILVGYTNTPKVVKNTLIQNPYTIGFFAYSFNLSIYDFNKNYGSWRHLFHKGTPIDTNTIMNYQSWENLIVDLPMQSIGVWLSPFTNNLRIAVTTTSSANKNTGSYEDAFIQKCNCLTSDCYITDMPGGKWVDKTKSGDNSTPKTKLSTYIEFFDSDLQNIPINKQINITINMLGSDAEVYFDGKIIKVVKLDGVPSISNTNLYVMHDNTFGGEISNLLYYPENLKLPDVNSILTLAPPSQLNSSQ